MDRNALLTALREPLTIGSLKLRNRIIRSATNDYRGNADGTLSAQQLELMTQLAKHHVGLIITANFFAGPDGRLDGYQNSLCTDEAAESFRALTQAVHGLGCSIVAQISHAGCASKVNAAAAAHYAAPSRLSQGDMARIIQEFGEAAVRAQSVGFDGVQLHCAHGYLLSDFLNPLRNDRTDGRGSDAVGRMKFPLQVLGEMRRSCGEQYPILVKTDAAIAYTGAWTEPEYRALWLEYVKLFVRAGVYALELSGCGLGSYPRTAHNYFQEALSDARNRTAIPLILTGGVRTWEDMASALESGADGIGVARPLIRDPAWAERLLEDGTPSLCLGCNRCYRLRRPDGKRCAFE